MLNSISSGYPVSGSFSRSSLNQNCGAKTPFSQVSFPILPVLIIYAYLLYPHQSVSSLLVTTLIVYPLCCFGNDSHLTFFVTGQVVTLCIILLVLSVLTQTFYFIPSAALAAIIWVAINNLIDFTVTNSLITSSLVLSHPFHPSFAYPFKHNTFLLPSPTLNSDCLLLAVCCV